MIKYDLTALIWWHIVICIVKNPDHFGLDKWSTHGLSIAQMPHVLIVKMEHLRYDSVGFNYFLLMMFHILCTISYHIKVKVKQTSRSKLKCS